MLSSCVWQVLLGNRGTQYILPSVPQLALDNLDIVNIWPFWHHRKTTLWMTFIISDFQRTVLLWILLTTLIFTSHSSLRIWSNAIWNFALMNPLGYTEKNSMALLCTLAPACSMVQLKITWIIKIDVLQKTILKQIRKWIIHCFP